MTRPIILVATAAILLCSAPFDAGAAESGCPHQRSSQRAGGWAYDGAGIPTAGTAYGSGYGSTANKGYRYGYNGHGGPYYGPSTKRGPSTWWLGTPSRKRQGQRPSGRVHLRGRW